MTIEKTCTKCIMRQSISEFCKDSQKRDGRCSQCKSCQHAAGKISRIAHKETRRKYEVQHRDLLNTLSRNWQIKNPDKYRTGNKATKAKRKEHYRKIDRDSFKRWAARNPEKLKASRKATKAKRADYYRELNRKWRIANAETLKQKRRVWQKANPEDRAMRAIYTRNYRARKNGSGGTHTKADIERLYAKQRGRCAYCTAKLNAKYHVDHIVAIFNGGTNDISNIQLLCRTCNLKKAHLDPIVFAQRQGLLL